MPFIRIETGPEKGTVHPIRSKRVSIGRAPQNDVVLFDETVSSVHAAVCYVNKAFYIEDSGSANGTFVNSVRVQRKRLRNKDEILLGTTLLTYSSGEPREETEEAPITRRDSVEILRGFDPATPSPASLELLRRDHENLRRVYEINRIISSIFDTAELCDKILDIIFPLFDADRGHVMLIDRDDGDLRLVAQKRRGGEADEAVDIAFSRTIARRVLETDESVITANAPEDGRFSRRESILDAHIKSAMCVPIRGRKEKLGAIYVDHRGEAGHFTDEQLQLLTMVANSVGIAIENIRLYEENLNMRILEAVNAEMRETNRKLVELEALKEDLINMVVHDMKNPVSNAMMGLDMIEFDPDGRLTEQQVRYLRLVKRNQFILSEMTTNLLEISRLESGNIEIVRSNINAPELLNRVVERYTAMIEMEGKSVSVDIDQAAQWMSADARLIERVIANILSNAIKHSYPGGEIALRVAPIENGGGVTISTQDFGEGIPEEYHSKIFEKFYHAGLRELGRKTDTGLGLAFCKMAVEAHGGTIDVESAPGKGSCFTITLPGALKME